MDNMKSTITERGDYWHPDPEKDKKLGGPGANQRAREDRAAASKPKSDPKKRRSGESYMDYAKRHGYKKSTPKKKSLLGRLGLRKEAYRVLAKDKGEEGKPSQFSYKDEKDAKKFADGINKKGGKATVTKEHHQKDKDGKVIEHGDGTPSSVEEGKGYQPEIEHSKLGDAKKKADKKRESKLPPHLQGDAIGKMKKAFSEEDKKGKGSGSKDACYHKVKASAKVWPSAYASGRLVQCRKKGAANYGNSKKESYSWRDELDFVKEGAAWTKKSGKNPKGGLNEKGRKSYEAENPGSDLKAPSKKPGNKRRASFCARMKGMKKKLTSAKTARDPDSRINKSLRAWNCGYEPDGTPIMEKDAALDFVRNKYKGQIYDPKKVKKPSEADKAKAAAERKKRQDADNKAYASRAKKAGFKSTQDYTDVVARYGSEDNYRKGKGLGT